MFNFFKKDKYDKKIPDDYKHLLTQREYEQMLDTILQYFKEKGEPVLRIEPGLVVAKGEGPDELEHHYGLDNLVRMVAKATKEDREAAIYTHFNRVGYDMRPLEYFKKDYEAAKQYLKILIKPESVLAEQGGKDVVYKRVLPGTVSVLVFDYDNKFVYLYKEMIREWGKSVDELFEYAMYNISQEDIQILNVNFKTNEDGDNNSNEIEDADTDPIAYVFINGDFAAPVMMGLEDMTPFAVGIFGSIITIPAKGAAISAPVNSEEILEYLSVINKLTRKYFDENPGNINTTVYWYYKNKYEAFPEKMAEEKPGYVAISVPDKLLQLLNEA